MLTAGASLLGARPFFNVPFSHLGLSSLSVQAACSKGRDGFTLSVVQ